MTKQAIDPAATPEADDLPEIAADDAGASAFAETFGRRADPADGGAADERGRDGEGIEATDLFRSSADPG